MMTFLRFSVFLISLSFFSISAFAADKPDNLLSAKEVKLAAEMNEVYARHMYTSACLNRQTGLYLPRMLTPEEKAMKIQSFKASCECLLDMALKEATPNGIIDYVTKTSGTHKSVPNADVNKKPRGEKEVLDRTPEFRRIGLISRGKESRKKCGFSQ